MAAGSAGATGSTGADSAPGGSRRSGIGGLFATTGAGSGATSTGTSADTRGETAGAAGGGGSLTVVAALPLKTRMMAARMPKQAFFHLLGFLDRFSERYEWEPGTAHEYLARLWTRADWQPFPHQMGGWVESSRYGRRTRETGQGGEDR